MLKHSQETNRNDNSYENRGLESIIRKLFGYGGNDAWANMDIFEWFSFIGLIFFAFLMPFLYSRYTTENFLTPKEFFTKMMIPGIAALYFSSRLLFSNKGFKLAKTTLDMPLCLFFSFMAFTLLFTGNAVQSGVRDLREVFSVLLLFPIIVNLFRARWQVEVLLWTLVSTGILTSCLGIMETYNWYFKINANSISYATEEIFSGYIDQSAIYIPFFPQLASKDYAMTSVVSTFGNRNYLGTFAMFTAFIPIGFFFYYRNFILKFISFATFGTILYGLYVSRCRAALVGIVLGAVFMAFIMLVNSKGKNLLNKRILTLVAAVSIAVLGMMFISVNTLKNMETTSIYDKLKTTLILDREKSNVYERMWVWYTNDKTFMESARNVLIGMGFGTFKHFFPLKESEYLSDRNRETFTPVTFRQAHNDWIQILSELGIVGLILFLFLLSRFFGIIQNALRRNIFAEPDGAINGDHILLISLLAAMISQLLAAIPDFPFHRIETAVYAVIVLAIVPVYTESDFFKHEVKCSVFYPSKSVKVSIGIIVIFSALFNYLYERKCWKADENIRSAEMYMKQESPEYYEVAERLLAAPGYGINLDVLPGDPYLKMAAIYERKASQTRNSDERLKNIEKALLFAQKAKANINFNARSTYHSVVFRELHIYYHILADLKKAREKAIEGLSLTAGDARSIYNFYLGKIDLDMINAKYELTSEDEKLAEESIENLEKAAKFESFALQSNMFMAIVAARTSKWEKALSASRFVNSKTGSNDSTMLDIEGVSLMNLNQFDEAESRLLAALAKSRYQRGSIDETTIRKDLGFLYIKKLDFDKAEEQLKMVLGMNNVSSALKEECERLLSNIRRK